MEKESEFSRCFKPHFGCFFKLPFYVSFDIFISTCRTTLIFLLTYSLKLGEYLRYLERGLKIIFHASRAIRKQNFLHKWKKNQNFRDASKRILDAFLSSLFTFSSIFSFLRVAQPGFFYWHFPWSWGSISDTLNVD